jgi:hypothetical protein
MSARQKAPLSTESAAVARRLDVLIALQLAQRPTADPVPTKDQIRRLKDLGLDNTMIGQILGKSSSYVSASVGSDGSKPRGRRKAARKGK